VLRGHERDRRGARVGLVGAARVSVGRGYPSSGAAELIVAPKWPDDGTPPAGGLGRTAMVRVAPCGRTQAVLADASQPPRLRARRVGEFPLSKVTDMMNSQAKLTPRTPSSLSHAFSTRVVRELPSLASVAQGSAQTW
jgi:hypothetical protein